MIESLRGRNDWYIMMNPFQVDNMYACARVREYVENVTTNYVTKPIPTSHVQYTISLKQMRTSRECEGSFMLSNYLSTLIGEARRI